MICAVATLVAAIGNFALQWQQLKLSRSNSDKLDDVHAATTSIAESTGTHKALEP